MPRGYIRVRARTLLSEQPSSNRDFRASLPLQPQQGDLTKPLIHDEIQHLPELLGSDGLQFGSQSKRLQGVEAALATIPEFPVVALEARLIQRPVSVALLSLIVHAPLAKLPIGDDTKH